MDQDQLRQTIRRTLEQRAGVAPDAPAVAGSTLLTWQQVAARLSPVIGGRGVEVLFGRALHLTSRAFPWLAAAGEAGVASVETLRARLAAHEATAAAEAGCAVLVTFTQLLGTLIGDSLSEHLLTPIWGPPAPQREQGRAS